MGKKVDWFSCSSEDNIFKMAKFGVQTMIGLSFLSATTSVIRNMFGWFWRDYHGQEKRKKKKEIETFNQWLKLLIRIYLV